MNVKLKVFFMKKSFVYVGLSIPMDRYGNGSSIPELLEL